MDRRRFLKYAGATAAVLGASALGLKYGITPRPIVSPPSSSTTTTATISSPVSTTSTSSVTSLQSLSDYLLSNGVSSTVADMASTYGTLDGNKKELGDLIIRIGDLEPDADFARIYQENLLNVLKKEDPSDITDGRLQTLNYMFSDQSMAINMLGSCMYPDVFSYLDIVTSKYGDVDRRIVYATLGIPRFTKVEENRSTFEAIIQRATDQQFKPAFNQMLSDGNIDKSKYDAIKRVYFTAFCTPIESLVWELLADDKRADVLLKDYDMKVLISDAFRNTRSSGNYRSAEWASVDTAANRLGFNSWINWTWVNDNMRYDSSFPPCCGDDRSMQEIYSSKRGVCRHAAYWTLHVLERGAIPAELLAIHFDDNRPADYKWHAITVEKKNEGFWNVMDFEGNGAQPMRGPFASDEKAVRGLIEGWNTGSYRATLLSWDVEAKTLFDED
jgi:hypothetical protein